MYLEQIKVENKITKSTAIDIIRETLKRFNLFLSYYRDNKEQLVYHTKLAKIAEELDVQRFPMLLMEYVHNDKIEILSSDGCKEFLLKVKQLSDEFHLFVDIPSDVTVISEDIVEKFLSELTERALQINKQNLVEIENIRKTYITQADDINLDRLEKRELEINIQKRQEYNKILEQYHEAYNVLDGLSKAQGRTPGINKEYFDEQFNKYKEICNDLHSKMNSIKAEYPLVQYINGKTDTKKVKHQVNDICNKIKSGLENVSESIRDGKYPIWEFTGLINDILLHYSKIEQDQILYTLNSWKSDKYKKDMFLSIGSTVLSIAAMFIPGGASFVLLVTRAIVVTTGAVMGTVQGIDDYNSAKLNKHTAYANLKLSDEQIQLIENTNPSDATIEYLLAGAFLALGIFDIMDSVESIKLIGKLNDLDTYTVTALKQSKRFGEKALQNIDVPKLNYIGQTEKATKVFDNIATLKVEQIPLALDFFPDRFNTNAIWLGMDNIEPKKVLTCSDSVCKKYNSISNNVDLAVNFSDNAKSVETKMNNLLKYNNPFDTSEKIALLKESLPPNNNLNPRTTYIRVQTVQKSTFAQPTKPFAWVTDPYVLAGNDLPNDFLRSVGFPESSMKVGKDEKIWFDVIVFKDAQTATKYVPNEVVDWNRIKNELAEGINKTLNDKSLDPKIIRKKENLINTIPDLISENNEFNTKLFEEKYLDYFMNQHMPGTKYEKQFEDLGDIIYDYTGASDLFTGSGITSSANGLENIERGFNNIDEFKISKMRDYRNVKIFRFEVQNDTSKAIKRVYIKEVK